MGMLERFTDIVKANINELLDHAEDPAKMVDQYLRDLADSLAEVKKETAGVMAEEKRTQRLVDENAAEVAKYDDLARQALKAGNEGDARTFLAKKQQLATKGESLASAAAAAHETAEKMRTAVAKTQDKVNDISSAGDSAAAAMSAFDRMEAKADEMLDRANAMSELNAEPVDSAAELEKKYAEAGSTASVDEELAKLKAEMGL